MHTGLDNSSLLSSKGTAIELLKGLLVGSEVGGRVRFLDGLEGRTFRISKVKNGV